MGPVRYDATLAELLSTTWPLLHRMQGRRGCRLEKVGEHTGSTL